MQDFDTSAIKSKAEALSEKMNKLTSKFAEQTTLADDMYLQGEDVEDVVTDILDSKYSDTSSKSFNDIIPTQDAINLQMLLDDFKYVRGVLKSNADDGRKIISAVTIDILSADESDKADLIKSFADLNKSIAINMDLYLKTYKEISNILVQLDKIRDKTNPEGAEDCKNGKVVLEVNATDLIKKIQKSKMELQEAEEAEEQRE